MEKQQKICTNCQIPKVLTDYHNSKTGKYGVKSVCKMCKIELANIHYTDNKEKHLEQKKEYYIQNKDCVVQRVVNYRNERMLTDPHFKMIENTRNLIRNAFKRKFTKKSGKTRDILGCDFEHFKLHIEAKFDDKMNWDNQGTYWVLDHITPIASAITYEDIIKLNHYTNFQPLEKIENICKGKKIEDVNGVLY
jgi:tellurite resistance-related uncharacterized protein